MLEYVKVKNFKNLNNWVYFESGIYINNNDIINSTLLVGNNWVWKTQLFELLHIVMSNITYINKLYKIENINTTKDSNIFSLKTFSGKAYEFYRDKKFIYDITIRIWWHDINIINLEKKMEIHISGHTFFLLKDDLWENSIEYNFFYWSYFKKYYWKENEKNLFCQKENNEIEKINLWFPDINTKSIYITNKNSVKFENFILLDNSYNFIDTAIWSDLLYNIFSSNVDEIDLLIKNVINKKITNVKFNYNFNWQSLYSYKKNDIFSLFEKVSQYNSLKVFIFILLFDVHNHKNSIWLEILRILGLENIDSIYNILIPDLEEIISQIISKNKIKELEDIIKDKDNFKLDQWLEYLDLKNNDKYNYSWWEYLLINSDKLVKVYDFFVSNSVNIYEEITKNDIDMWVYWDIVEFAYNIWLIKFLPIFNENIRFEELSSWEQKFIKILIPLYDIIENNKTNILFIDEVENHLNPEWQELIKDKFEKIVKSIIKQKNYSEETTIQIFYSTHSIILPTSFHSQEIIKLENTKEWNVCRVLKNEIFWQPYDYVFDEIYRIFSISWKFSDFYLKKIIYFLNSKWCDINQYELDNISDLKAIVEDYCETFNSNFIQDLFYLYIIESDSLLYNVIQAQIKLLIKKYWKSISSQHTFSKKFENFSQSNLDFIKSKTSLNINFWNHVE
jgi:hypothetical protein